jgi:hypothetical protein
VAQAQQVPAPYRAREAVVVVAAVVLMQEAPSATQWLSAVMAARVVMALPMRRVARGTPVVMRL